MVYQSSASLCPPFDCRRIVCLLADCFLVLVLLPVYMKLIQRSDITIYESFTEECMATDPQKKKKTWRLLDCLVSSIISMPVPARPYQSRFSLCLDLFQCCISYIWLTDFRALVLAVVLECHCVCLFQSFRELKSCSSLINAERYDRLAELSAVLWSPLFWFQ
jgi:hypothetical protein